MGGGREGGEEGEREGRRERGRGGGGEGGEEERAMGRGREGRREQTGLHVWHYFTSTAILLSTGRPLIMHGNADSLSRLPFGPDPSFDGEEGDADVDTVCAIRTISLQLNPMDPGVLAKESAKDPVLAKVMLFTREGWSPKADPEDQGKDYSVEGFRKISASLSTAHGYLLYSSRVIIPPSLQPQVLELLHLGHFGMQRMKQLAHTAVYWPRIDTNIMNQGHRCSTCAEHHNMPTKAPNHP